VTNTQRRRRQICYAEQLFELLIAREESLLHQAYSRTGRETHKEMLDFLRRQLRDCYDATGVTAMTKTSKDWVIPILHEPPALYTLTFDDRPLGGISGTTNDPEAVQFKLKDMGEVCRAYLDDRLGALETKIGIALIYKHPANSTDMHDANEAEAAAWERALTAIKHDGYLTEGALVCPRCELDPLYPAIMGTLYLSEPVTLTVEPRYSRLGNVTTTGIVPHTDAAGDTAITIWLFCTCGNCDRGWLYDGNISLELTFDADGNTRLHWDYSERVVYDTGTKLWSQVRREDTS
jgi:hypothetical protein